MGDVATTDAAPPSTASDTVSAATRCQRLFAQMAPLAVLMRELRSCPGHTSLPFQRALCALCFQGTLARWPPAATYLHAFVQRYADDVMGACDELCDELTEVLEQALAAG
jgi:hypothetical protein